MIPYHADHDGPLTEEVLAELADLPPELWDTAVRMLAGFARSARSAGLTPRDIAAIIASPSFRPVLEDDQRLNSLTLAQAS